MSAKEAAGSLVFKALVVLLVLFLVAAWQTGLIQSVWAQLTSNVDVPSVEFNNK